MEGQNLFPAAYRNPVPSPDGEFLAWISDRDGRPRAWVAALPADGSPLTEPGWPLPTTADDPLPGDVTALSWSPDGAWLACQLAPAGGERTRVRAISPDGAELRDIAPGAAAATLGVWSPNGRQLGVTLFPEGSSDGYACLVDLRDGTSTVLTHGPAARVSAISGDGRRAVVRLGRRGARSLELIDLYTGRHTNLVPGGEANVAEARFGVTGDKLYVHTDAGREHAALLAVTLHGDGEPPLFHLVVERADDDLDLFTLDPAGARAALVWNVSGASESELLDLRTGLLDKLPEAPGEVVTAAAFTRDGAALLLASEGPTVSPRLTRIGLDPLGGDDAVTPLIPAVRPLGPASDPSARLLGPASDPSVRLLGPASDPSARLLGPASDPSVPADPPADGVTPTLHTFHGEDGLALQGWLFAPRITLGPQPTLIWLHGGPEAQERPVFQPLFQALVAHGVSVFAPNVRGSGGYGRSFACADDHDRRFVAITDVRAATEYLIDAGLADPERLGVSGRSYGGYLTLVALAWFPELFQVGVDVCGISDFDTFYANTEPWIAEAATTKYGDPGADAELLRALSPLHRVDHIRAPLLVVHGAHDTNVPLLEAQQVVDALRARGAAPGFLLFDDEGHEVTDRDNRALFVREVVSWVTAHLLDIGEQTA